MKLDNLSVHLKHWSKMTHVQRSEIEQVVRAAILGEPTKLIRPHNKVGVGDKPWPLDFCKLVQDAVKQRIKEGA